MIFLLLCFLMARILLRDQQEGLYFFEQKSYEEISDILHLPKNTVGTLIARGKSELKNFLIASL